MSVSKQRGPQAPHFIPLDLAHIIHTQSKLPQQTHWREHMTEISGTANSEAECYFRLVYETLVRQCYATTETPKTSNPGISTSTLSPA